MVRSLCKQHPVSIGGVTGTGAYFATKEATINLLGTSTFQAPANFLFLNNYSSIAGNSPDDGFFVDAAGEDQDVFVYSTGY